jgi:endoglycosylceramidase
MMRRHVAGRRWFGGLVVLVAMAVLVVGCAFPRPVLPLRHEGRWFTDAAGRVVMLRGVNFVQKWAPYTPEAAGFDEDDAALLADSGFNAVRLGVVFEFLMPEPGAIDFDYLDSIDRTVDILSDHGLFVLLDFHQDGYGPATHGNGMPVWATITDGLPNPPAPFPTYYVENPALQRAFDNFWANRAGPDGVPLQEHYATAMRTVAERFASSSHVIGYEPMNEPWPGTDWFPCLNGCPDLETQLLRPFYDRMISAVRSVDKRHPVFEEPFVLFNFGFTDTVLPGAQSGRQSVLSTHVYALDPAADGAVMDRSVAAAERDGVAVLITEWGAVDDAATLVRLQDQLDERLLPWMFWSHNGHIVVDSNLPLVPPNLKTAVLDPLTRPYPVLVNGTPTAIEFDDATSTLDFRYTSRRPGGDVGPRSLATTIDVPQGRYPDGYRAIVTGAKVTSEPCAPELIVRNHPGARDVSVRIEPGGCD